MRETPLRRACLPAGWSLLPVRKRVSPRPPLSFVNDASSSATIHRREKPVVRCTAAVSLVPTGPADRRRRTGTTFLARRVVSAPPPTDSTADGRPATGSRALAVEATAAAGRLLRYPVAAHTRRRGFPTCSRSSYNEIRFSSTPISPRIVSTVRGGVTNRFTKRFDKRR